MLGHPFVEAHDLFGRHGEPQLGTPPDDISGCFGPFLLHQVPHLGLAQTAAELLAEIVRRTRASEYSGGTGAVGAGYPFEVKLLETGILSHQFFNQLRKALHRKVTARQGSCMRPSLLIHAREMRGEEIEGFFREAAISCDLSAEDGKEGGAAVRINLQLVIACCSLRCINTIIQQ